jgi:hypothetical protein
MEVIEKLKSDIRDVKINIILGNIILMKPNIKRLRKGNNRFFNQKYWKILKEYKGQIITGSCSLYAYGLLDRMPSDIDLIVDKSSFTPSKKLLTDERYSEFDTIGYFRDHGYYIDVFDNNNAKYIEIDGFLLHDPFEIIDKKLEMGREDSKDIHDIIYILKKFNPNYKF